MIRATLTGLHPSAKLIALVLIILGTFLLAVFIGMAVLIPIYGPAVTGMIGPEADITDPQTLALMKYFQVISQLGVFIIPSFIFAMLVSSNPGVYLRLDKVPSGIILVLSILIIFTILPFLNRIIELNNNIEFPSWLSGLETWFKNMESQAARLTDAFLSSIHFSGFMVNLFMIGLLAAVGEELIFRGIVQRLFTEWFRSRHLAIIIAALIFSAFHLQFYGVIPRFVLGLILGYLFAWSGSLWVPILVHFMNNAMAVLVSYLGNLGIIQADYEEFGYTSNIFLIITSIAVTGMIMAFIYRKRIPEAIDQTGNS